MNMPSNETVDNFLMHHGVKGQKWGVRRMTSATSGGGSSSSPSGARGSSPSSSSKAKIQTLETKVKTAAGDPKTRAEAITAAKTAFTVTKYGVVPLAAATGIGIPAIAGLGISANILSNPAVREAVVSAGKYSKSVLKDIGSVKMSDIHLKNPFSVSTRSGPSSVPGKNGKPYQLRTGGPNPNITVGALNAVLSGRHSSKKS